MIKNFTFNNFYSFADEAVIDFALGKKPTPSGYDIVVDGQRYNKAVAVVGANGSGKTQLLKPFAFLSWFVVDSFLKVDPDDKIPCEPHLLKADKPSLFELEFMMGGVDYRYELKIVEKEVSFEALYEKTSSQFSYLFKREKTNKGYEFRQKGFPFQKAQAERIRGNASLIAAAHSYDVPEASPFVDFFDLISSNVVDSGRLPFARSDVMRVAEEFHKRPVTMARVSEAMCKFDLGLSDIDIRRVFGPNDKGSEELFYLPYGIHRTEEDETFELPFLYESSGTQSAFVLLEPILRALHGGGIAVIDELDNDLHPHLVPQLLEWFEYDHTNPHQAQLIFTCHTPEVLNLLQKHQVYLVEKRNQRSEAWRLDEMTGLRADDNLYAKYMAGALGATPEL
ncbi:MAG TPA: ATP-binding protein [Saccharospirillum sp.]|nr:ATP-binding protein [Saccharospirillum sp.]